MKIIYNNIIPFKGFKCINLFGVLFVRKGCFMSEEDLNHERIHTAQMKEMLYVFFYLWYFVEWLIELCHSALLLITQIRLSEKRLPMMRT